LVEGRRWDRFSGDSDHNIPRLYRFVDIWPVRRGFGRGYNFRPKSLQQGLIVGGIGGRWMVGSIRRGRLLYRSLIFGLALRPASYRCFVWSCFGLEGGEREEGVGSEGIGSSIIGRVGRFELLVCSESSSYSYLPLLAPAERLNSILCWLVVVSLVRLCVAHGPQIGENSAVV
jgi:hypothetical protein